MFLTHEGQNDIFKLTVEAFDVLSYFISNMLYVDVEAFSLRPLESR